MTHVLPTARISNDDRVLYNDTETLMVRLLSHLLGSYVTDDLHTARISNDETVLYNDTETIIVTVNIISYLLVSYVTHVLHTVGSAMTKEYCMYNDMRTLIKTLLSLLTVLSMRFSRARSQRQVPSITLLIQLHLVYANDGI